MNITKVETKQANRGIFRTEMATLRTATIVSDGHTLKFSQWEGETYWACDSHIGPTGRPHFVHGEGARDCGKQTASAPLAAEIEFRFNNGYLKM